MCTDSRMLQYRLDSDAMLMMTGSNQSGRNFCEEKHDNIYNLATVLHDLAQQCRV